MSPQAAMNTQVHAPRTDTALAHVLAIDDDPILREAIVDYLGQYEFRVTAVADGAGRRSGRPRRAGSQAADRGRDGTRSPAARGVGDPDHHAHRSSRRSGP